MIKWNSIKGYVLVVVSGLFLLAAGILVISNIGNSCDLTCYWTILHSQSIGVALLIAGGVGVVAVWMLKLLVRGVRDIKRGRKAAAIDKINQLEKAQSKKQTT